MEECHTLHIYSQEAALQYLGSKLIAKRFLTAASKIKSPMEDARDLLATTVLAHVPVDDYNFYDKAVYLAVMVSVLEMLITFFLFSVFASVHNIFVSYFRSNVL